ncbi:glycoside hydrolase family 15 protein [Dermacoccaceae bacterium W4C1]
MTTPISEYAVIGDHETAALISRAGALDWLCVPRFDSAACFAALLGRPEHGRWLLGPAGPATSTRRYLPGTMVLETIHETDSGSIRVTDLMPTGDERADIVRVVEGLTGEVQLRHEWQVRFGYGAIRPWVSRQHERHLDQPVVALSAVAGPDRLLLHGTRLPLADHGRHAETWTVRAGDREEFVTTWVPSWAPLPTAIGVTESIERTVAESRAWVSRGHYQGRYVDAVERSVLVLRLLTDRRRGGIVAAATTSLPEDFGGERNWDYRFCWLRDASLTLEALLAVGFTEETLLWRDWLVRALAGDPEDMQIMYGVDGARELPERELAHLPGYADSRPVRIGNGAVEQKQTDVLGEVMLALEAARVAGVREHPQSWSVQRALVDQLAATWREPDNGLWEIRGPQRRFTHSQVMVWAALDRAVLACTEHGLTGDHEHWAAVRDEVREQVLREGFDTEQNTFVQHPETTEVDASLLVIPQVGFLPGDDPRVLGTIAAVEAHLLRDGLVLRYRTASGVDGLSGDEHPFLACSFWLVSAYALAGRTADAQALMDRLVGLANDVGLLAEEYDPQGNRMAGNVPQAFSHLALVKAAVHLERALAAGPGSAERPANPSTR